MQRQNYAKQQDKIKTGLCARRDCLNPRAPNKKDSQRLGRVCAKHALQNNERARVHYLKQKARKTVLSSNQSAIDCTSGGTCQIALG
jgi:hypothetical protein